MNPQYSYAGAGFVLICQSVTLICVAIQIHRIHEKTGSWLFTLCGRGVHGRRHRNIHAAEEDAEKALGISMPFGRRRRGVAGSTSRLELHADPTTSDPAVFSLPRHRREHSRRPRRTAGS